MPQQVESISIMNSSIIFYITESGGTSEIVTMSNVPIQGDITSTAGMHYITFQSAGNYVNISST